MDNERWVPIIVRHLWEEFEKAVYETYQVSDFCRVRNVKTGKVLEGKGDRCLLTVAGVSKSFMKHRLCLASFYPDKIPKDIDKYDCDHIDGNHDNMVLENLQWLKKGEHSKKTHKSLKKCVKRKQGKPVEIIDVKNNGDKALLGATFNSTYCVAEQLGLPHQNVASSARLGFWVRDYKFKYVETPLLQGEEFRKFKGYEFSNKGRYKNRDGKISIGNKTTGPAKLRSVFLKLNGEDKKSHYMHNLIWRAFNGPITEGKIIAHKQDCNTIDEEGYYRNHLTDLYETTQAECMQHYYENDKSLKRVRCIDDDEIYHCAASAAKRYRTFTGNVAKVCKGERKKAGGKKFEYVKF
jgi:hypothetical protein